MPIAIRMTALGTEGGANDAIVECRQVHQRADDVVGGERDQCELSLTAGARPDRPEQPGPSQECDALSAHQEISGRRCTYAHDRQHCRGRDQVRKADHGKDQGGQPDERGRKRHGPMLLASMARRDIDNARRLLKAVT